MTLRPLLFAAALAASAAAHAQVFDASPSQHPLTRAEVRHELEELEASGFWPGGGDDPSYPSNIQAAETRLAQLHEAQRNAVASTPATPQADLTR
jgi:hypothetical protein